MVVVECLQHERREMGLPLRAMDRTKLNVDVVRADGMTVNVGAEGVVLSGGSGLIRWRQPFEEACGRLNGLF